MPTRTKRKTMSPARKEPDKSSYSGRFAARLRMLREKAGLTVADVAEQMNVTPTTIYHWESAHSFPKPEQLPLLAETLNLKSARTLFPE